MQAIAFEWKPGFSQFLPWLSFFTHTSSLHHPTMTISDRLSNNKWRWWMPTDGLTAQVGWLGLSVSSRLAQLQSEWTGWTLLCHDDSTINIAAVIVVIISHYSSWVKNCYKCRSTEMNLRRDSLVELYKLWMCRCHRAARRVSWESSKTSLKPLTDRLKWHTTHKTRLKPLTDRLKWHTTHKTSLKPLTHRLKWHTTQKTKGN